MEWLEKFWASLSSNSWMTAGSFLLAIVGVVLSIVFYLRSRNFPNPRYRIRFNIILEDFASKLEGLRVLYGRQRVRNLVSTHIVFWNGGRGTLDSSHVSQAGPVTIKAKADVRVHQAKIIHSTAVHSLFELSEIEGERAFALKFDFVDPGDGCVIQVVHNGPDGDAIGISGVFKGGQLLDARLLHKRVENVARYVGISGAIVMLVGLAVALVIASFFGKDSGRPYAVIPLVGLAAILVAGGIGSIYEMLIRPPKRLLRYWIQDINSRKQKRVN